MQITTKNKKDIMHWKRLYLSRLEGIFSNLKDMDIYTPETSLAKWIEEGEILVKQAIEKQAEIYLEKIDNSEEITLPRRIFGYR